MKEDSSKGKGRKEVVDERISKVLKFVEMIGVDKLNQVLVFHNKKEEVGLIKG